MKKVKWGARAPYRVLVVSSPAVRGPDVRALQQAINDRDAGDPSRGIGRVEVDGEYGPQTEAAAQRASWALGTLASTQAKHGTTVGEQTYIRAPHVRPKKAVKRGKARLRTGGGAAAAIAAARGKRGVHETPAGSNKGGLGGFITAIQVALIGWAGWPWCGAFLAWAARQGGARPHARWRYTPWIVEDAKAKRNGFRGWHDVGKAFVPKGSAVLFDFNGGVVDHVGLLTQDYHPGDTTVHTCDGNTSGSNPADGGMVEEVERSIRTVRGFALIAY